MHLVCFGDSICYGYGARPGEGWVAQMTRMLATLREPVAVTGREPASPTGSSRISSTSCPACWSFFSFRGM